MLYRYRCQVVNVVDGDTVDCLIDLGLRITSWQRIRLWGINAPKLADPTKDAGLSAASYLRFMLIGKPLVIQTLKDREEKYGRLLGLFWETGAETSVNQKMLGAGKAVPYMVTLEENGRLPIPR